MSSRRIAVIGSGIAGLTAGYVLAPSDEVTLFEADDRLGGHAHTHELQRRADHRGEAGCAARLRRVRGPHQRLYTAPAASRLMRADPAGPADAA